MCWLIPDFAASIVELLNSLIASDTWFSFATWELKPETEFSKITWFSITTINLLFHHILTVSFLQELHSALQ